jgi:phosphatidylserine/phosphatidylglycerophosphate/cardiolipin synthase-like enzyme
MNSSILLRYLTALLVVWMSGPASAQSLSDWIDESCADCISRMERQTGAYILERGEEALIGRAWLASHAQQSIDIQYFIWSTDNIGTLAAEQLLRAAERGVTVRVIVDDLLIDARDESLLLLSAHDNVDVRIYNPNLTVGTSLFSKLKNVILQFRSINQRMHDKTAIFDGIAGITGGRNMADEYFDFDPYYNFRDRDILLLGPAVADMSENFNEFWESELTVPVEDILDPDTSTISASAVRQKIAELRVYAADPTNFDPAVRNAITMVSESIPALLDDMQWQNVEFISDAVFSGGRWRVDSALGGYHSWCKGKCADPVAIPGHAERRYRVICRTHRTRRTYPHNDQLTRFYG